MYNNFMLNIFKRYYFTTIFIYSVFLITACQPRVSMHGNFFNEDMISDITKIKLNKSEIKEIFGNPTTTSTFSDNVWYYISLVQHEKYYFEVKNISNKVLKITFDKNQNVKEYKILTGKDSFNIEVSDNKTVSSLTEEKNFIQEFFSGFIRKLETP